MAKKILVVVDMQNDFTTGVLRSDGCESAILPVVQVIRNGSYDCALATRDTHGKNYMETQEGKNLPIAHCIRDTQGWEIVPEVAEALEETFGENLVIFDKPTFGSVQLAEYLRDQYGDGQDIQIDFVGVCTGICVISNVTLVKAFCPEAKVRVFAYACACVTPESHETALDAMRTFQVEVIE